MTTEESSDAKSPLIDACRIALATRRPHIQVCDLKGDDEEVMTVFYDDIPDAICDFLVMVSKLPSQWIGEVINSDVVTETLVGDDECEVLVKIHKWAVQDALTALSKAIEIIPVRTRQ